MRIGCAFTALRSKNEAGNLSSPSRRHHTTRRRSPRRLWSLEPTYRVVFVLLRFERSHVDREAVLHIGPEQSLVGFVDLLDRDHLNIRREVVRSAKVQHLLGLGDAADI